jgi:hypothetical protein
MSKIPIFIIVHNQYEILKKTVESYEKNIKTPFEIIFHNVASNYYKTVEYLKGQKQNGYTVYHSKINNHHTVMNSVKDYISKNKNCKYCVITDPDIMFSEINGDILELYIYALNKLKCVTVGPMLDINDIPDYYPRKQEVIKGHTDQFWRRKRHTIEFNGNNYEYILCNTDTTFQLFATNNLPPSFPHSNSVRFFAPYSAKHLDWYIDPNNLTPCQLFYLNNTTQISHWNNSNWKGTYHGIKINEIKQISKYKYIYYCKCKCKNNTNFGDMITEYIYIKRTGKKPINDIKGGNDNSNVVFGAGSILNQARNNSIIWGSGIMFQNDKFSKPKQIISVRGPLSRQRCIELGYECPEVYGDIGLILPYFYNPVINKKYKIGLIPHYIDYDLCKKIFKNTQGIKIIDITNPVEMVIRELLECKMILSSSLHGIIAAHAYNIKCIWVRFSDKIAGGYTKFRDYYGSVVLNYNDIVPYEIKKILSIDEMIKLTDEYINPIFPIDTKHIIDSIPF